jgi:hypothetical protein
MNLKEWMDAGGDKCDGLRKAVTTRLESGDIEEALNLTNLIERPLTKAYSLQDIAEVQVIIGDIPGALETANMITHNKFKRATLCHIAREQAKNGDVSDALETANRVTGSLEAKCRVLNAVTTTALKHILNSRIIE